MKKMNEYSMKGSVIAIIAVIVCVLSMMSMSMSAGAAMYLRPTGTGTATSTGVGDSSNPISAAFAAAAPAVPGVAAAPGAAAASDYFGTALASGPSACRVPGNPKYSGYSTHPEKDMTKCRDNCLKDPKCKAFESDGNHCWYYGGAERQTAHVAGTKNQCYVKK